MISNERLIELIQKECGAECSESPKGQVRSIDYSVQHAG